MLLFSLQSSLTRTVQRKTICSVKQYLNVMAKFLMRKDTYKKEMLSKMGVFYCIYINQVDSFLDIFDSPSPFVGHFTK